MFCRGQSRAIETTTMSEQSFPPGWDEERIREVVAHFKPQTKDTQRAENEVARQAGVASLAAPTDAVQNSTAWAPVLRLVTMVVTAVACVGAGATAGVAAFASELTWPLSPANFAGSALMGAYWGIACGAIAAICLAALNRKHLWIAAVLAVVVTWFVTCAGVWWLLVSNLG
jgi:hypothetical protein